MTVGQTRNKMLFKFLIVPLKWLSDLGFLYPCVKFVFLVLVFSFDFNRLISVVSRVFTNGPGDLGSIPGLVMPKTLKMVLDTSLFNTQQYKVLSRVKWNNQRKGVAPSPTPRCSSYWKLSLLFVLDYGCQLITKDNKW